MYNNQRIMALIPARGGSKGIKNKNIIDLCGKPLIAHTVDAAKECSYIDDIIVSTDSKAIADVAVKYGAHVPFIRPDKLAQDRSTTLDVVLHAINEMKCRGCEYDILILLQPTSPLRNTDDIKGAIEEFCDKKVKSLVSVSEVNDSPVLIRQIGEDMKLEKLLDLSSTIRRQDMKKYYRVNGAIYINRIIDIDNETSFNDNEYGYIMDKKHSVDIDEMMDVVYARLLMENNQ